MKLTSTLLTYTFSSRGWIRVRRAGVTALTASARRPEFQNARAAWFVLVSAGSSYRLRSARAIRGGLARGSWPPAHLLLRHHFYRDANEGIHMTSTTRQYSAAASHARNAVEKTA